MISSRSLLLGGKKGPYRIMWCYMGCIGGVIWAFCRSMIPVVENQMDTKVDNEMDTVSVGSSEQSAIVVNVQKQVSAVPPMKQTHNTRPTGILSFLTMVAFLLKT